MLSEEHIITSEPSDEDADDESNVHRNYIEPVNVSKTETAPEENENRNNNMVKRFNLRR